MLEHWVRRLGYRPIVADSADTALDITRSMPVDVVICDLCMPHHDGLWLISTLEREQPSIAIVIASAMIDPAATVGTRIAAYIVKPFDRNALAIALQVAQTMKTVSARH